MDFNQPLIITFLMGSKESLIGQASKRSQTAQAIIPDNLSKEESPRLRFTRRQPYKLTQLALQTYGHLKKQHGNSQYLDIPYIQENHQEVKELEQFSLVKLYDACYKGTMKKLQPHGRGIAIFPNGCILIGTFSNGYCCGDKNYFIYKDGSYFVGKMTFNQLSGKGKYISKRLEYDGDWHDNIPHGQGTQVFPNGDRYIGRFEKGFKNGKNSLFIWSNHQKYISYRGNFTNGKIKGHGILELRNKCTIEGDFDESSINSCNFSSEKIKFNGNIIQGRPEGKGTLSLSNSFVGYGSFKNGQLHGDFKITDEKGRESTGYFFKNRQLKKVVGLSDDQVEKIINAVSQAYESARKHSEAIIEIRQQFEDEFSCHFVEHFENHFNYPSYAIIEIFNKALLIKIKSQKEHQYDTSPRTSPKKSASKALTIN